MGQPANAMRIDQLAGFPVARAEELAALGELRVYQDGTLVFDQGEEVPGIFLVSKGALKVFRSDGRGKVQLIDVIQPGGCVGEVQVFDGGLSACGAKAMGRTECWLLPALPLRLLASRDNAVVMSMFPHLARKIRHLIALVETLSLHTVPERVAQLILEYQSRNPARVLVEFTETQDELAQRIGSSREAFSRGLRLLSDLGLIQSTYPVVRILDLNKLQSYAQG
jgi:CRP/FNR family transcriptional regulator